MVLGGLALRLKKKRGKGGGGGRKEPKKKREKVKVGPRAWAVVVVGVRTYDTVESSIIRMSL